MKNPKPKRVYVSKSKWLPCPNCGLEVRAVKPKLCDACYRRKQRKEKHNKEVDKVINGLKKIKADLAKESFFIRCYFRGKVEALIRRANATKR